MLRHTRYWKPVDTFEDNVAYEALLQGHYVYAGQTYHHFGHIMSEFVHRIIPSLEIERDPNWIFVTTTNYPKVIFEEYRPFFQEIYKYLGVNPSKVKILNQNTEVESLLIVESGSDLGGGPKPGYLDTVADYSHSRLDELFGGEPSPAKVYVSRSGIPTGSFLGEKYIEAALKREGFTIFQPEKHPFARQLDIYRKAEILIFPEGSACHGTELLGTRMIRHCAFLARRGDHNDLFQRVLKPRSQTFASFTETKYLGTAITHPGSNSPASYLGVSLFDFDALVEFFRSSGIARLPDVQTREYLASVDIDLIAYLEHQALNNQHFDNIEFIKEIFSTLSTQRSIMLSK